MRNLLFRSLVVVFAGFLLGSIWMGFWIYRDWKVRSDYESIRREHFGHDRCDPVDEAGRARIARAVTPGWKKLNALGCRTIPLMLSELRASPTPECGYEQAFRWELTECLRFWTPYDEQNSLPNVEAWYGSHRWKHWWEPWASCQGQMNYNCQ